MWVIHTEVGMILLRMDRKHRVTLPKEVRKRFRMIEGQKFFLLPYGDDLIIKSIPKDPSKELSRIIEDFQFDREDRRKAEKWLLQETTRRRKRSS